MAAIEDMVGFFVHAVGGKEDIDAGRVGSRIGGVEIDNVVLEKEVG